MSARPYSSIDDSELSDMELVLAVEQRLGGVHKLAAALEVNRATPNAWKHRLRRGRSLSRDKRRALRRLLEGEGEQGRPAGDVAPSLPYNLDDLLEVPSPSAPSDELATLPSDYHERYREHLERVERRLEQHAKQLQAELRIVRDTLLFEYRTKQRVTTVS